MSRGPAWGLGAAAIALALLAGTACGHYTSPLRIVPPPQELGPIYDAGQPMEDGGAEP